MADGVFLVGSGFGKGYVPSLRLKYRVITKAFRAATMGQYTTLNDSFKRMSLAVADKAYHGAKACTAIGYAIHSGEQLFHIRLRVMTLAGIAGAHHAGSASKRLHFESCIVGKAVISIVLFDPVSLDSSVFLEGCACLRYIVIAANIAQSEHLIATLHQPAHLGKLMAIVSGKYESLHCYFDVIVLR